MVKTKEGVWMDGPVHNSFGLTYASYLVVPRMVLEAMPFEWQEQFVAMMDELHETIEYDEPDYNVTARKNRRFISDPLRDYRHPDRSLLTFLKESE